MGIHFTFGADHRYELTSKLLRIESEYIQAVYDFKYSNEDAYSRTFDKALELRSRMFDANMALRREGVYSHRRCEVGGEVYEMLDEAMRYKERELRDRQKSLFSWTIRI